MVADRNPQVGRAVVKLRELSADEQARDLYERREKAPRDKIIIFPIIAWSVSRFIF